MADQEKGILLPNRTTRGNRYKRLIRDDDIDDEQQEDKEFWQQEFFKDEERDDQYLTESEPSDIFESDFLDTVRWGAGLGTYRLWVHVVGLLSMCINAQEDEDEEAGPADDDDGRPRYATVFALVSYSYTLLLQSPLQHTARNLSSLPDTNNVPLHSNENVQPEKRHSRKKTAPAPLTKNQSSPPKHPPP